VIRSIGVGSIAALSGSAVLAVATSFHVGFVEHPLGAATWLFTVSVAPAVLVTIGVELVARRVARTVARLWFVAALAAFVSVALAGSVGAIAVQAARFGLEQVNWCGYVIWGPIYGVLLLPVTCPIALGATHLLWRNSG